MLIGKKIAVCSQIHTEQTNTDDGILYIRKSQHVPASCTLLIHSLQHTYKQRTYK